MVGKRPHVNKIHYLLREAGCERSRWLRSSRVRGWGRSTAGYEAQPDELDQTAIRVTYIAGDWAGDQKDQDRVRDMNLGQYKAILEAAGLGVVWKKRPWEYLLVRYLSAADEQAEAK